MVTAISSLQASHSVRAFYYGNRMDIQRLRNLTTGRLHTEMAHIYQDIEYLTSER